MDERVEEIRAISRISLVRKVALARHGRGRRELMYQFDRDQKAQEPERNNKKIPHVSQSTGASTVHNSNDYAVDLKKRIAFDRAVIIGD